MSLRTNLQLPAGDRLLWIGSGLSAITRLSHSQRCTYFLSQLTLSRRSPLMPTLWTSVSWTNF